MGPVGHVVAALLGQAGHSVGIFDRQSSLYPLPRIGHLDHEVMRIVQAVGDADAFEAAAYACKSYDWLNAAGQVLIHFDRSGQEATGWHSQHLFYRPDLDAVLRDTLARLPNVVMHRDGRRSRSMPLDLQRPIIGIEGGSFPMTDTGPMPGNPGLLTHAAFSARLPSRPLVASPAHTWNRVSVHLHRHPPSIIDAPGLQDILVVDHLTGPVLVENKPVGERSERRWTGPGMVTMTPAGEPLHREIRGVPEVALLLLAPELLRETAQEFDGRHPDEATIVPCFAEPDREADRLVRLLLAEAESPGPATSLVADTLARALAVQLLRFHSDAALRVAAPPVTIAAPHLRRVIELMQSSLDEELTLEQLAAAGGLSQSHFSRAFNRATGQPPHRYLVSLRIERARVLLEKTELTITEVGMRCGFGQPSHFATAFRKASGLSPRAWRELRRS